MVLKYTPYRLLSSEERVLFWAVLRALITSCEALLSFGRFCKDSTVGIASAPATATTAIAIISSRIVNPAPLSHVGHFKILIWFFVK